MSQNQSIQSNPNGPVSLAQPDSEVAVAAQRRQFTVADKRRILDETDRCEPGQIGAILRREGLYSSHLSKWRRQRAAGELSGRATRPGEREPQATALAALHRENERLQSQLEQARLIIEVQKKLCQLFGLPAQPEDGSN
jgi:transposase-like protein